MKQFDVFSWQPPGWNEPHPCVIISHPGRIANKPEVNVVMCSTQRAGRRAESHEVILDTADGMEWPTLCKCDLIHVVPKSALKNRRGQVSDTRKFQLIQRIIAAQGWGEIAMIHRP